MSPRAVAFALVVSVAAACASQPAPTTTVVPPAAGSAPPSSAFTATPTSTTAPVAASTTTRPPSTTTTTLSPLVGLDTEIVADGLDQPIILASPPGDGRRFVAERSGVIRILGNDEPFLDIDERVDSESGIEPGLLGLAFHPDYADNGRFFVFYSQAGAERTRLSEFGVTAGEPDRADHDSEREIIGFEKATNRHNGGMIQFGPDGYLWLSLGEGGQASVHSQDPDTLLSSILRLDVDGDEPYAVPPDNPFAGGGGAPEVWAYGLRNPWRFSIDPVDGHVYIADVGHSDWEEVNAVPATTGGGFNFGWLRMEGFHCFQRGCDAQTEGLTLPVLEYPHAEGCSITGGAVYRGTAIPELTGHYLYSDWCGGWLRSFRLEDGAATDQTEWLTGIGQVNGFGQDSSGELYLLTWDGRVLGIVPVR